MDRLLTGVEDFAAAYLDDLIVYSGTWEEHKRHLREIFGRLRRAGLMAKLGKCQMAMEECTYLGHRVGNGRVKPEPDKLYVVQAFPQPATKKDVRAFLGLTDYYRRFIPNYSQLALPLTDLTRKNSPSKIWWSSRVQTGIHRVETKVMQHSYLELPRLQQTFCVADGCIQAGSWGGAEPER